MIMTKEFIEKMNALVPGTGVLEPVGGEGIAVVEEPFEAAIENVAEIVGAEPNEEPIVLPVTEPLVEVQEVVQEEDVPDLVAQDGHESDDEAEDDDDEVVEAETVSNRRSARVAAGVRQPARYRQVMYSVKCSNKQDKKKEEKERSDEAEMAEIQLVFEDLKAVEAVRKEDIPEGFKAHNTHLFTVEKFLADGAHDKTKSRIVAHGDEQDTTMYADRYSPTAGIHSIMSCLTVVACNPEYKVAKLDVKGAFIQTEMSGTPVYVQFRGKLKEKILRVKPELTRYVGVDGILYCKLLQALYGCVQASRLWYEKLKRVLLGLDYTQSETDPCVSRRIVGKRVFLLVVYVNDILILASEDEIKRLGKAFTAEFRWITLETGNRHSYLGMQLEFLPDAVKIDMGFYVEKVLKEYEDVKNVILPARKDLFYVDEKSFALDLTSAVKFHTTVAQLLYLSRRGPPDIITAVGFLCT